MNTNTALQATAGINQASVDYDWNPPVQTITTGNITVGSVLPYVYPQGWWNGYPLYQNGYYYVTQAPTECCGDVHVFPCPHCEKCKCGAATVKRSKKRQ